jgi:hypothetical protein
MRKIKRKKKRKLKRTHRKLTFILNLHRYVKEPEAKKSPAKTIAEDELARRRLIYNKIKELDKEEGGLF